MRPCSDASFGSVNNKGGDAERDGERLKNIQLVELTNFEGNRTKKFRGSKNGACAEADKIELAHG